MPVSFNETQPRSFTEALPVAAFALRQQGCVAAAGTACRQSPERLPSGPYHRKLADPCPEVTTVLTSTIDRFRLSLNFLCVESCPYTYFFIFCPLLLRVTFVRSSCVCSGACTLFILIALRYLILWLYHHLSIRWCIVLWSISSLGFLCIVLM